MGKKGSSKNAKGASAKAPKCTCDHPYNCDCGNRPPRPSKGHKWDPETQQWGGKGHKQKGASIQAASKGVEAKTTEVGKTTIAQWQRLPTQLLDEVTKKEGRPRAKFKQIGHYKFRVIVQDAKAARRGTDHDLLFVPAEACENIEQAKEEAALLALLHMTPSIPHERKLPEPYKTTWLHAVKAAKEAKKSSRANGAASATTASKQDKKPPGQNVAASAEGGAKASTNLTMSQGFASVADRKRQREAKRQARVTRIRKHEAERMANRDHQVFLSAQTRKRIETLLRGEAIQWNEESGDDEEDADDESDLKMYIVERLSNEGFTRSQARTAIGQLKDGDVANANEDTWDNLYDQCLQWLCIHLDEDQLPEGFDPRGRTLDVVVATSKPSSVSSLSVESGNANERALAKEHGLSVQDAKFILKNSPSNQSWALWNAVKEKSGATLASSASVDKERMKEIARDEMEALEAIFSPEELTVQNLGEATVLKIRIQSNDDSQSLKLEIEINNTLYPAIHPTRVTVHGSWKSAFGIAVHLGLVNFVSELPVEEPMIYEIYGKAQTLLQEASDGDLKPISLSQKNAVAKPGGASPKSASRAKTAAVVPRASQTTRRPRERAPFWRMPPKDTPKAISFPTIDSTIKAQRSSLPAAKARSEFLAVMESAEKGGRVVLVTGDTGCGKTTQIPQFILEESPGEAKIVVAQPRRLAATGVAGRVASERGESRPGKASVGYVVRGDTAMCASTRLVFCTTGVLLRQLQSEHALDCITHIIVDEVHERHLDTDVLLGVLKESLKTTKHLRIVLMSATLDADRFAAYWGKNTPRMHIPGRTFPVTDYMLEDVLTVTGYIPPKNGKKKRNFGGGYHSKKKSSPWADSEHSEDEDDTNTLETRSIGTETTTSSISSTIAHGIPIGDLVKRVDESRVDYDMLGRLVRYLVNTKKDNGSILVFMSGAPEIIAAMETIGKITRGMNVQLLPLHGGLQPKDQNLVFNPARHGYTKVILSTNVAETSITIPDCTVVIDSCREKQSSYDPVNRMPLLLERFAAKASLKQRRGRAGRVQAGTCYKLISKATYEKLQEHGTPEIHRCALDQTLLSLLFLGVEKGSGNFLSTLLDPPNQASLNSAITSLQKIGAVSHPDGAGNIALTPLGMHLAGIPAPPAVGKILVMGSILGCRSAALAMAAGMSVGRSPWLRIDDFKNRKNKEETTEDMKRDRTLNARKELFKTVGSSDHAMLAAAYMEWDSVTAGGGERKKYCEMYGLSFNGLRDMKQLVRQLDSSLSSAGYYASEESDRNASSWRIIRCCVVAALAPSQIVRVQRPSTKYAETHSGALEKEGEARELHFYIQAGDGHTDTSPNITRRYHDVAEERVFMHPSSFNFSTGNYSCPWLVYHELVRTSKPFLRDATECSAYALLLFGGKLEVQAQNGLIVIEDRVRLAANARIGALIGGLRKKIDDLLSRKVEDPRFDIGGTIEMKLIRSLLVTDGLG